MGIVYWLLSLFLIGNGVLAALPFIFILSPSFYIAIVPSLLVGSFINLTIAHFLYPPLASRLPRGEIRMIEHRDALSISITDKDELIIASDCSGGIGNKPGDAGPG